MLTDEQLNELKKLVDAGKINANKISFTIELLEELLEIPEDADEETIRSILEKNKEIAERNRLRKENAKKLSELLESLS